MNGTMLADETSRKILQLQKKFVGFLMKSLRKFKNGSTIKQYSELIEFVNDRPGHDFRYAIDPTKIETELGWVAEENFEDGLEKTIRWYLNKITG